MAKKTKQKDSDKFVGIGSKIDPAMNDVLNACCDILQVDVYHLLQWFAYTIVRASSPMHELDPRIQKLLAMMESDVGWQQAFNIANPGQLKVAQLIMILEQPGRKGFGAVMIDRPFMGDARQTECVDQILERVCKVTMRGIYRRLRLIGTKMGCRNLSDVLLTMIDEQTMLDLDEGFRAELPGMGDRADNGKAYAYGKKTKSKHRRTVDSLANSQQRIVFNDEDRQLAEEEVKRDNAPTDPDDMEKEMGFKPFGQEW